MGTLKDRVGRYALGRAGHRPGDQCRNREADQNELIELLNIIPIGSGGKGGTLRPRVVDGICDNELYQAILTFEKKNLSGPPTGFVDMRGGPVLAKILEQARVRVRASFPEDSPAETPLDVLRRNVEEVKPYGHNWPVGDVIQLENIKPIALKYIDDLKKTKDKAGMPATDLPSFAVLFGRAYVLSATDLWVDHRNDGSRPAEVSDRSGKRRPVVDVMHVGTQLQHSIMPSVFVATFGSPALILFRAESDLSGGGVLLIPRERQINVGGIYRSNVRRGKGQWVINYPTIQLPDYGSVTIRQSVHDLSE